MFKATVKKQGVVSNEASFPTMVELNLWLEREEANQSFGKPEHTLIDSPSSPVSEELKAIALSTSIVEQLGEEFTAYVIPSEYEVEIVDISAEVEAQSIVNQIAELEAQITPRRMREALIGNVQALTFIEGIESEIELLRATL